ncbi:protein MpGH17.4 [Marchantia polymorpha subsp. ruderalis]|uniref:glucan endo-1,3-beta-D-glucosidase n=1 Tax=Marchantia polymorpha TaxID=3197 RepID=A0A2R6XGX3_MARPO|nr:hypothetical protein MARPO_0015s0161 [Marchantia polymorpha]BBN01606.1 hypothetical protein Mp_2g08760 [Marchantia polymorpha subsp. ruderalis]|eukprot:PTQ45373.1 hypothetical protein MARPO_0015s0161 [Marchantia polymorpha]
MARRNTESCRAKRILGLVLLVSCILSSSAVDNDFVEDQKIGINYGRIADNIPNPTQAVALMRQMNIGKVRIYDADASVLTALGDSGLQVAMSVTHDLIGGLAGDANVADQWIQANVVAYPRTQIRFIIVGNELFSYPALNLTWYQVLPAMNNLHDSLVKRGLSDTVKITTSLAMDILGLSYPPSAGQFRSDIEMSLMKPILALLTKTHSTLFVNVYPYFAWASNPTDISVDYALFGNGPQLVPVQDGTYVYKSLLDAQLDALIAAMDKVGYGEAKIAVGETGWPTAGDASQTGANIAYAAYYNRRLVRRVLSSPPTGTPKRAGVFIPTYLFALFNEDQKPGPATERNWGLLYANGSEVYPVDLTGKLQDDAYPPLQVPTATTPPATDPKDSAGSPATSQPFVTAGTWCIANPAATPETLQPALDYACGQGGADCALIQAGAACYLPNSLHDHSSYAFNQYYQTHKKTGGTCDFGGTAQLSTVDPSSGTCTYLYVEP